MKRITLCRIYENSPEAVEAVSFSPCARFIAVARHLGSIQLLDASSFYVYATLPNIFIHGSANSIIWLSKTPSDSAYVDQVQRKLSQYHLVATGLHGLITYWDLESLMPLHTSQSYGGAIFSSAYSASQLRLYLACDDSTLRVFSLYKAQPQAKTPQPELVLVDVIKHAKGKILSVTLYDDVIFCGTCESTIYKHSGNSTVTMKLGRRGKSIQVWSLVYVTGDKILISGDSLGIIRFWDTSQCIEVRALEQHSADILCMAITLDQKTLYVGGVDMKLTTLAKDLAGDNWTVVSVRYPHKASIKALDVDPKFGRVVTGGEDCNLCLLKGLRDLSGLPHQIAKFLPLPSPTESSIDISINDSIVLCKGRTAVHVWALYDSEQMDGKPVKLATISLDKSEGDLTVASVAKIGTVTTEINTHVCVGNNMGIKLFKVTKEAIKKIDVSVTGTYCYCVKFTSEDHLLCSTIDKDTKRCHLINYSIKNGMINRHPMEQPVVRIEILSSVLVSLFCLSGSVIILDWEKWQVVELPDMNPPEIITTVCLFPSGNECYESSKIIAIGSDCTYYIFNLVTCLIETFNGKTFHKIPPGLLKVDDSLINFSVGTEKTLILQTCTSLMSFTPYSVGVSRGNDTIQRKSIANVIEESKKLRLGPPLLYEPRFKIISLEMASHIEDHREGNGVAADGTGGDVANCSALDMEYNSLCGWKTVRIEHLIQLVRRQEDFLAFQISSLDVDLQDRGCKYGMS